VDAHPFATDVQLDPDLGRVARSVSLERPDSLVLGIVPFEQRHAQGFDESRFAHLVAPADHAHAARKRPEVEPPSERTDILHR
jgi:hypothetical protein